MKKRDQQGFTLIEVLVACVIVAVIGIGVTLFCHRDIKLQERLRVHATLDVVRRGVVAMVKGNALPVSSSQPSMSGEWREGALVWDYTVQWLSRDEFADDVAIKLCEQASQRCWSQTVLRWRYAAH